MTFAETSHSRLHSELPSTIKILQLNFVISIRATLSLSFLSPSKCGGKCKNAAAKLIRKGERESCDGKGARRTAWDRWREKEAEQEISSAAILGEICLH